jgi:hypothetical protein
VENAQVLKVAPFARAESDGRVLQLKRAWPVGKGQ